MFSRAVADQRRMRATIYFRPRLPSRILLDGWWLAGTVTLQGGRNPLPCHRAGAPRGAAILCFPPRGRFARLQDEARL
jgi:hypothetical protein